ncbi:MAG: hypothetical protein EAZ78_06675 [Oscillatoriales cyanobacterium]|uniref:Uncharacterized protein n=1 Tax=Microcoleus anatoxicus PTRS2 TaxID=2705321 RepID=A0ABU8YS15_9CYAN|nr:MAG: hypothetical protein EA000_09570 [Oscillatoriales cyanobacterium]TAD98858.1 MAG: hypothetical protein EAZ98_05585 [Oscillatoriales cyanobacterium]TAE06876.1 MAG: hypothetical protein EAZ96_01180 [Oscillatoriales cyanobacterium]TAF05014.1 MAG: hypothetical protein EAZ78_06675 [Oscillatoriales cyanobacterium]
MAPRKASITIILGKKLLANVDPQLEICESEGDLVLRLLKQIPIDSPQIVNFEVWRSATSAEIDYLKCEC